MIVTCNKQVIPWRRTLIEMLIFPQILKTFLAFYGTRKFIAVSKKNLSIVPTLNQANPIHIQTSYFFNPHFDVFSHVVNTRNKERSLVNCVAFNYIT
jgi:hypothetical protein